MIPLKILVPAGLVLILGSCSEAPPELVPVSPPGSSAPSGTLRGSTETNGMAGPAGGSPLSKSKVGQVFEEAKKSADSGNFGSAAGLLEEVVKADPKHREALVMLAMVDQDRASELDPPRRAEAYLRSAWAIRQIQSNFKDLDAIEKQLLPVALYNEAMTLALQGKTEPAYQSLSEAVDAGFSDPKKLRTDPDLAPLRKLPKFSELVDRTEGRLKQLASERARSILDETKGFSIQFKLPGLDEKTVSSADLRGKVVIVDFWGTWCPPCRKEIPFLVALSKKYKDQGLEVVGINYEQTTDAAEARTMIASFVKENNIPYPCLIGDDATKAQVRDFQGFPTTLYVDREGNVRGKVVGFSPEDPIDARAMEELVTTLLAAENSSTSGKKP